MKEYTFGRKKVNTSTDSNPSLVSPNIPTLANPVRGFGLPKDHIQTATQELASQQEPLTLEAIKQRSFGHDLSRIALHRPQTEQAQAEPGDEYEQNADWIANQVLQRPKSTDVNSSALTQPFVGDNSQTAIHLKIHPGGVSRYLVPVTPPVEPEAIAIDKADVEAEAQQEQVQQTVTPAQEVAPPEAQSQQASAPAENPSDADGEQGKVASANTKETLIKSNQDSIPFQKFTQQTLTLKDQEQTDLVDKSRKDADAAVAKSRQDGDVVADGRSVGYKPGIEYLLKQGGSRYYDTIITMTKNASQEERRSVSGDPKMRELIVKHLSPPQATAVMAAVLQGEQRWQQSPLSEFADRMVNSKEDNPPFMSYSATMNCWEMILYAAYLLGQINGKQIKNFMTQSYGGFDAERKIWENLGWKERSFFLQRTCAKRRERGYA